MRQTEVIFCGKSLYISGLAAGAQTNGNYRVIRLEWPICQTGEEIKILRPDFVVFELSETSDEEIQNFINTFPNICLVGVKPEDDTMTVFYKEGGQAASVDRLHLFMKIKGIFAS